MQVPRIPQDNQQENVLSRKAMFLLFLFVVLHLFASLSHFLPAPTLTDGIVLQMQTKALASGNGYRIQNGYEEVPSKELTYREFVVPYNGRLIGQYPGLMPFLASFTYNKLHITSLILVNIFAFIIVLLLTFSLARKITRSELWGAVACGILSLGTYAWEYSLYAVPHILSLALCLGAYHFVYNALFDSHDRPFRSLFSAGLLIGVGITARVDVLFFGGSLLVVLFFLYRKAPLRAVMFFAAGMCPGLLWQSIENQIKFGVFFPAYYPVSSERPDAVTIYTRFLPVVLLGGAAVAFAVWMPRVKKYFPSKLTVKSAGGALVAVVCLLGACVLLFPEAVHKGMGAIRNVVSLTIDMRFITRLRKDLGLDADGNVMFSRFYKKAFFQSVPYLACVLFFWSGRRPSRKENRRHLFFALPVLLLLIAFGTSGWCGGPVANMRYFIHVLPVISIWVTLCLRQMYADASVTRRNPLTYQVLTAVPAASIVLLFFLFETQIISSSVFVLRVPLLLFFAVGVVALLPVIKDSLVRLTLPVLIALTLMALVWSALMNCNYDLQTSKLSRVGYLSIGYIYNEVVENGATLISENDCSFGNVLDYDDIRIVFPLRDTFTDLDRLCGLYLDQGRKIYVGGRPEFFAWFYKDSIRLKFNLDDYRLREVKNVNGYKVMELSRPDAHQKERTYP